MDVLVGLLIVALGSSNQQDSILELGKLLAGSRYFCLVGFSTVRYFPGTSRGYWSDGLVSNGR